MRTYKLIAAGIAVLVSASGFASSHREAPFTAQNPSIDGTDFYMFRSYESGRSGFVTILANYNPLQDSYGGPNYFALNPDALYEIHIDNNGDAVEDLTFQFRFTNTFAGTAVNGNTDSSTPAVNVAIPLVNLPPTGNVPTLTRTETYTVDLIRGPRRGTTPSAATKLINAADSTSVFTKPIDNIGTKTIPNYAAYAKQYIYNVNIPGCTPPDGTSAKLFVGQRKEGFVVNLGEIFDLVHLNPLGARSGNPNTIGDKNITTIALEVPVSCLTAGTEPVIGGWTTASLRQARVLNPVPNGPVNGSNSSSTGKLTAYGPEVVGGAWTQVSRLGSPLVNEVVIGITDKDKFNSSEPKNDVATFANYVLYPSLPVLINALFPGATTVPATPRIDLLNAFVTGIQATLGTGASATTIDFTHPKSVLLASPFTGAGEMLRLNTAFPAAPVTPGATGYSDLGFLGCDLAGFPNGRRPGDDVVDIELSVAEGALTGANPLQTCDLSSGTPTVAHSGTVVTDGVKAAIADYLGTFPYLNTPMPGSPNGANGFPADTN